tara:strand:+ start:1190 stop:1390 length:201 start_codon:yes stop_codon:yes gene_type:complete
MSEKTESNYETCEPHWPSLFELATQIVRSEIDEDKGRLLVVEMLQYGKRMSEVHIEAAEEKDYDED